MRSFTQATSRGWPVVVFTLLVGCASHLPASGAGQIVKPASARCVRASNYYDHQGPALTIPQVEAKLLEVRRPGAPQLSLENNPRWLELRALAQEGDTFHEYDDTYSGGIVLIRRGCIVAQWMRWIV